MIRILQCVNNMHRAGLETMLMNYYRNIDRTKIQFDFLTHRKERSDYDDEIESLGGKVYHAPRLYPQNYPAYFSYMKRFFAKHPEYQIIHSHIDPMSYLPLLAAKRAGVPVRIAHSHSTSIDRDLKYPLKQCFRYGIPSVATHNFACGEEAGRFLFRKHDFTVIPNAVDLGKFHYDSSLRRDEREKLQLHGRFVVGHVGRMTYPKNHKFLIEIFASILKKEPNAVLLLVGNGEKEQEVKEQVAAMGLTEQVLLLGSRSDVHELYQAMDVLVMPSLFEGVPVVGIEAQASGVPCVFSDRVPREVAISSCCRFLPLEQTPEQWAEEIVGFGIRRQESAPCDLCRYDIKPASLSLEHRYLELYEQIGE